MRAVPSCRILMVTTFGRAGYLRRAMEAGALGFFVKDAPAEQLADAIRRVARGERVVDPQLAAATLASGASSLTARERDVLVAARHGATIADVAARLHLSEGTVRNYLSSAITKTGGRNRIEAVRRRRRARLALMTRQFAGRLVAPPGKLEAMTGVIVHRTTAELEAGLAEIRRSPRDGGRLELIVRRPAVEAREVLDEATLDETVGLVGDTWSQRPSTRTDDGSPHPRMQLNVMNARAVALIAVDPERRQLAGDQLYVDLDLSEANLPAGTRLAIGTAVIEITEQPHRGCAKFAARFGTDALRFVNSDAGRSINARGVNAAVVVGGVIRAGDVATKLV